MAKDISPRSSHSRYAVGSFLALLILLVIFGAAGLLAFLPLIPCPQEDHQVPEEIRLQRPCYLCAGRGKISYLEHSRSGDGPLPYWEGKRITRVVCRGFRRTTSQGLLLGVTFPAGSTARHRRLADYIKMVHGSGDYINVNLVVVNDPANPAQVIVTVDVDEK
jgi:hypothetical protein